MMIGFAYACVSQKYSFMCLINFDDFETKDDPLTMTDSMVKRWYKNGVLHRDGINPQ